MPRRRSNKRVGVGPHLRRGRYVHGHTRRRRRGSTGVGCALPTLVVLAAVGELLRRGRRGDGRG